MEYIFFDRDGTLIEHVHHLIDPAMVKIKEFAFEGLGLLQKNNFRFGIMTNQSVIGRKLCTLERVNEINHIIARYFASQEIYFDFIKICPHAPEEKCLCRKPLPTMGLEASTMYDIELNRSFMIGDQLSDMQFGKALGMTTILLSTELFNQSQKDIDFVADNLLSASKWIVSRKND